MLLWKRKLVGLNQSTVNNSRQMNYCTAFPRSDWHNGCGSKPACTCVCATIMRFCSSTCDLWVRGQHPRRPLEHAQWRSIQKPAEDGDAGEEHSLRCETSSRLSSPRFPLSSLSRAACSDCSHLQTASHSFNTPCRTFRHTRSACIPEFLTACWDWPGT